MATIRDEDVKSGRLVQSRLTNAYDGDPQAFPLDDFYIGRGSDGALHAWYVYPPSFFGRMRGCRIIWDGAATPDGASFVAPGVYIDPCGGAKFDRDGRLVSGEADRGLDFFSTEGGIEGAIVDTRTLFCGAEPAAATPTASASPRAAASATPSPAPTAEPETCERVSPDSKRR